MAFWGLREIYKLSLAKENFFPNPDIHSVGEILPRTVDMLNLLLDVARSDKLWNSIFLHW